MIQTVDIISELVPIELGTVYIGCKAVLIRYSFYNYVTRECVNLLIIESRALSDAE